MTNLKNYIEMILLIILMACMYTGRCELLGEMMNNNLGKLSLLSLVVLILCYFGKTAGVLAGCIFVFNLHTHRREGFNDDEEEEKEGFSIKIGGDNKDDEKDGFWSRKNTEEGMDGKEAEGYCSKCGAKKHKNRKGKKEGFANLRQNRRLKINNISVLNTTDLDRIIKKDSEVRTLNSTA